MPNRNDQTAAENARLRKELEAYRQQQNRDTQAQNALAGNPSGSILSGSAKEQQGQIAGLNLGATAYGQGLTEAGQDVQSIKGRMEERAKQSGADPVSAAMMGQKASAMANAQRAQAQSGVKGGAATMAMEDMSRERDQEIAKSLYGQARQSDQDLRSLVGNIISGTTGLMQGEKAANVQMPSSNQSGGLTVVCTELHRQGLLPSDILELDAAYGEYLRLHNPNVIIGYHFIAAPIVKLMQKSTLFTKIVSIPALGWAYHMAGKKISLVGILCHDVGEPLCGFVGKLISFWRRKYV